MRSILNKVTRFYRNLSNASKIRSAYKKKHTVRKRLENINIGIIVCLYVFVVALIAMLVCPEAFNGAEKLGCMTIACLAIWLHGYRRAIAFGQTNRQAYIANTRTAFRRICRGLGLLFVVLVGMAVIITVLMVVAQKYGFLTDVFPPLKGIADCIIARLNEMLSNLLAKMS